MQGPKRRRVPSRQLNLNAAASRWQVSLKLSESYRKRSFVTDAALAVLNYKSARNVRHALYLKSNQGTKCHP
jgi:hypothetical protein